MSTIRKGRAPMHLLLVSLALTASIIFALALSANPATGDEPAAPSESFAPTATQTKEALESGDAQPLLDEPETDLQAAQTMPHRELGRGEALELAEAVFQPELESPGGIYDELEPERLLGDNAAIVPVSSLPEDPEQTGESLSSERPNMPVLVESLLPLRTENSSGETEAVDLQLEHSEGELQPQNPITEVGIPTQLGEGISMAGSEVAITVSETPGGRTATNAEGEFAFYPEVAQDSDLIVTPTPQGVETMVDLRSADAPTETTYELALPAAAELRANEQGGAEVVEGAQATLVILPPTAVDAAGDPVQTELAVSGDGVTIVTKPTPSTAFPVLVDPVFIEEGWRWTFNHDSMAAWSSSRNTEAFKPFGYQPWIAGPPGQYPGLALSEGRSTSEAHPEDHADWEYWVPRYRTDLSEGLEAPTTWVYQMNVEGPAFYEYGNTENYPALVMGLVDPTYGWAGKWAVHYGGQGDMNEWGHWFPYTNPTEQHGVKGADMDLVTYVNEYPTKLRDTYIPDAYVAVVDEAPAVVKELGPQLQWIKTTVAPAFYLAEDTGFGVKSLEVSYEGHALKEISYACGDAITPCPRVVTQKQQPLEFNTALPGAEMPTGLDWVTVTARDPMWNLGVGGHTGSMKMQVKVDHTGPEVSLSGPLTEQGNLGFKRASYVLRVNATDGVQGAPQSGVGRVEIKVDNKKVPMAEEAEWEPKCQTENCPFSGEWTLNASEYAPGRHEVQVVSTDAVGNPTTKLLEIELHPPAPTLAVSGSLTEQATLGTERPSYRLQVNASALTESPPAANLPTYSSSFGTSGTAGGQFAHPGDVALGNEGMLFVVDTNNNRIEKFNGAGGFVKAFGTKGAEAGQLERPTAIAVAASGNLWVTNAGENNKRVEEFTPEGAYVTRFGGGGPGAGQFAGSGPEGIAIDYHGNIWVSDTYGGRLEKFGEAGNFIRSVGVKGTGLEQLWNPTAIEVAPGGQVYVTDWTNDKVLEYGESGAFIRQFGSQGNEPGQLQQPTGIAIDSRGDVWVGDQENQRVEEFNQAGEYLGKFGTAGSGAGQFKLQYPVGMATDAVGDIWVTDPLDNRVEKWVSAGYTSSIMPTFLRSFGTSGTTAGHFSAVGGIAVDAKGDPWTVDWNTDLLQKWGPAGELLGAYGGAGSESGKLANPNGLAFSGGHLWAAEVGNSRIQAFSEAGAYFSKFGQAGAAAGQLNGPWGVAVDSAHHVWVPEWSGNRLQEFGETGTLVRTVGGEGTAAGKFVHPSAVAVGPGGKVWVTDQGNNRVEEFTETGGFVREIAGSSSGVGRVLEPTGIYVDPSEHVWVVDAGFNTITEYTGTGEYLGKFGSSGTGPGNFTSPSGIAGDGGGHLWVSDTGNHRVDEWAVPTAHSAVSTSITVDGRRVEGGETACAAGTCPSSREWTLNASTLAAGAHTVVVTATDGLGNTTSKTLKVSTGDTTKPGLEVGGELVSAPEGWVQQEEGSYGFHATATDTGFGVTALVFKVDGKSVASKEQTCAAGRCSASITTSVNVKELAAGAHEAEVKATDGAGNTTTKGWTINVDPEGVISTEELAATAEAMEETSGSSILAPGEIPGMSGSTAGTGFTQEGEGSAYRATGTYVPMEVALEPEEGFRLFVNGLTGVAVACDEAEEGEPCAPRAALEAEVAAEEAEVAAGLKHPGMLPITVKPVETPGTATEAVLLEEQAIGSANAAGEEADTFTRPMADGGLSFAAIRSGASPEHYAFEMNYSPELKLQQVNPQEIEVVYWKYGVTAGLITGEPAHDAIGTTVPTHLTISGPAKITLTVEHRGTSPIGGGFVYPVMGGTGWQGGFYSEGYEMNNSPPPPAENGEEEDWPGEGEETVVGPPEASTPQEAGITDVAMTKKAEHTTTRRFIQHIRCEHRWEVPPYSLRRPGETLCGNPFTHQEAAEIMALNFGIQAHIYVSPGNFVLHKGSPTNGVNCAQELFPRHWGEGEVLIHPEYSISPAKPCEWLGASQGNGGQEVGPGHHLCLYGEWVGGEGKSEHFGTAGFVESVYSADGYQASWYKTVKYKCNRP